MALYQKYRPRKFNQVLGQESAVHTLQRALATGKTPHALLLAGSHGTGKTTLARLVAQGVCCEKEDRPCGECETCLLVARSQHPDVWEMDAASHRGVDDARRLSERTIHSPMRGKAHVMILDEAHMLTREAQNALLKTIEEPVGQVHIILCTTEAHKLLPTILSRCQRYPLLRPSVETLAEALEYVGEAEEVPRDEEGIELLAQAAMGSFRDGLSLLEQVWTGWGNVQKETVRAALMLPGDQLIEQTIQKAIEEDWQGFAQWCSDIQNQGVDWKMLLHQIADRAADEILKNPSQMKQYLMVIDAADLALKSALRPSLALQAALQNQKSLSLEAPQTAQPSQTMQKVPKAVGGEKELSPQAAIPQAAEGADNGVGLCKGEWSKERIEIALPLIALAARNSQPEVYLALRSARVQSSSNCLSLLSEDYPNIPDGLEAWVQKWGKVDVVWEGKKENIAENIASPLETPIQVESSEETGEEDLDGQLAELGILAWEDES